MRKSGSSSWPSETCAASEAGTERGRQIAESLALRETTGCDQFLGLRRFKWKTRWFGRRILLTRKPTNPSKRSVDMVWRGRRRDLS
jgi:hypothetical protein